MNKKIFFFDIDGTLKTRKGITQRVKDAILNIQKQGHLCFIASGRPPAFISKDIQEIGFDGYILNNGATIIYKDQIIIDERFNIQDIKELLDDFDNNNIKYILESSTQCYLYKENKYLVEFYKEVGADFNKVQLSYDRNTILPEICKLECWAGEATQTSTGYTFKCDEKKKEEIITKLNHFSFVNYKDMGIEVYPKHVSKATGIEVLLNYLGIDYDETYSFGDGMNDLEMFHAVKHSYAMDNASDQVKKEAKYICPSIEEDGVAVILEKISG